MNDPRRIGRLRSTQAAAVAVMLAVLVVGCSGDQDSEEEPVASSSAPASASADPVDPQPAPEPYESGGPAGGPAFEPTSTGAPLVDRGQAPATRQATVPPATFAEDAIWSDGLEATTRGFTRGTITATGVGAVSGAPYVTIEVELQNLSETGIALDSVVPTLLISGVPAAPTYDVPEVADLSGVLEPGARVTGTYGFQIDPDVDEGTFYLDVDADHAVASFSGSFG